MANEGKGQTIDDLLTRQRKRAILRELNWSRFSNPPMRDEHGIIPRRIRRDMAGFRRRRKV